MSERILVQCQCDTAEDTGDGFVIYRRNDNGEEEVHILNSTAYEIFEMCTAKTKTEIIESFRRKYNLDSQDQASVASAVDEMLAKGIIAVR